MKEIIKQYKQCRVLENKLAMAKGNLLNAIRPYIVNDTNIPDNDIYVEYLSGDGFGFMIDDTGVSIAEMIDRITKLKNGEKILLSELERYL